MFSAEEKAVILGNEMLTGESINLSTNLLSKQFPNLKGFTDSTIVKCQQFDIVPPHAPYIQILHAGSLHWICVANTLPTKKENQTHYIFDSLASSKVKVDVIAQVAAYSFCVADELLLQVMQVQQQKMVLIAVHLQSLSLQVLHLEKIQLKSAIRPRTCEHT